MRNSLISASNNRNREQFGLALCHFLSHIKPEKIGNFSNEVEGKTEGPCHLAGEAWFIWSCIPHLLVASATDRAYFSRGFKLHSIIKAR